MKNKTKEATCERPLQSQLYGLVIVREILQNLFTVSVFWKHSLKGSDTLQTQIGHNPLLPFHFPAVLFTLQGQWPLSNKLIFMFSLCVCVCVCVCVSVCLSVCTVTCLQSSFNTITYSSATHTQDPLTSHCSYYSRTLVYFHLGSS